MKRYLKALAAAVSLSLLAGCNTAPNDAHIYGNIEEVPMDSSENITVNLFGYKTDPANLMAIENAIHGFMNENPNIEIVYEGIEGEVFVEAFKLRAQNNNLDDMFMIRHDQFVNLSSKGELADLSDISTIGKFNNLSKIQFTEPDGSVYIIPTAVTTYGMYVNLDLLKENGFDPPTNFSEFSAQCDYFKSKGITPIIGNNYSTLYTLMSSKSLYPIYQSDNAAEMIEQFNTGEADIMEYLKEGVKLVDTMLEKGWFDIEELKNTEQSTDDLELFAKGGRPFMFTGGWTSRKLMDMDHDFEFAVYPYPVLESGSVLDIDISFCLSVNAQSECIEESKKFIEYLTQPDVIYDLCDTQNSFSPLADSPMPSDSFLAPTVEHLSGGSFIIGTDYRLELPINEAEQAVGEKMLDGMSAEDAIELLSKLMNQ